MAGISDPVAGAAEGFTITPFAAGHLVGGCAWRITTPEDEDIVYAVHYNHRKQACPHSPLEDLHEHALRLRLRHCRLPCAIKFVIESQVGGGA